MYLERGCSPHCWLPTQSHAPLPDEQNSGFVQYPPLRDGAPGEGLNSDPPKLVVAVSSPGQRLLPAGASGTGLAKGTLVGASWALSALTKCRKDETHPLRCWQLSCLFAYDVLKEANFRMTEQKERPGFPDDSPWVSWCPVALSLCLK